MSFLPSFYICSVFRRLQHLMANICWTKRDSDNRARTFESAKGLLRCRKTSRTLVHKLLKMEPEFLPTSGNFALCLFHCQASHTEPKQTLPNGRKWSMMRAVVSPQVTSVINLVVGCRYFPPGPRLLSQPKISPSWSVPNYTAWWQRHTVVSSLPKSTTQWCPARTGTRDL